MKRIQIRPGKFVTVSTEMAEKAARAFSSVAFSQDEIRAIAAEESRRKMTSGAMLGQGGKIRPKGAKKAQESMA